MYSTIASPRFTHPAARAFSFAFLAGGLTLASLGSSPAQGSEPAAAPLPAAAPAQKALPQKQDVAAQASPASNPDAIAEAPVVPVDEPLIDPKQIDPGQGSLPQQCPPISFGACCMRTVSPACAYLCDYDKFASTCTPGVTTCKAKNLAPGERSTSHPYFSTRTSTGKYLGWTMACNVVQ